MGELGGQSPPEERRVALRFQVRAPVEYEDSTSGHGLTWDISLSGVRIENASAPVGLGTTLELRFSFFPGSFETPLGGNVVRHTDSGFAAKFISLQGFQRDLLRRALPPSA